MLKYDQLGKVSGRTQERKKAYAGPYPKPSWRSLSTPWLRTYFMLFSFSIEGFTRNLVFHKANSLLKGFHFKVGVYSMCWRWDAINTHISLHWPSVGKLLNIVTQWAVQDKIYSLYKRYSRDHELGCHSYPWPGDKEQNWMCFLGARDGITLPPEKPRCSRLTSHVSEEPPHLVAVIL